MEWITEDLQLNEEGVSMEDQAWALKDKFCGNKTDEYLLMLPNAQATRNLKDTLCSVTAEDLFFLYIDLQMALDDWTLFDQVLFSF